MPFVYPFDGKGKTRWIEDDIAGFFVAEKREGDSVGLVHLVIRNGWNGSHQFFIASRSAHAAILCAGACGSDGVADCCGVSGADFR